MATANNTQIDQAVPNVAATLPVAAGVPRRDLLNALLRALLADIAASEQDIAALEQALAGKLDSTLANPITTLKASPGDLDRLFLLDMANGGVGVLTTRAALLAGVYGRLDSVEAAVLALQQGGGGSATAPAALTVGLWSISAAGTTGAANLNIIALPSTGGSPITALEYRIGTGAAVALSGVGTGVRNLSGFTDGQSTNVQVRAVNAIGAGPWSDTKSVTTTAAGVPANVSWDSVVLSNAASNQLNSTGITPTHPTGGTSADMLVAVLDHVGDASATAGITPPAGWTPVGSIFNGSSFGTPGGALGSMVYIAPGNTAPGLWTGAIPAGGVGYSQPRFAVHLVRNASVVRSFVTQNEMEFGVGDPAMPSPSAPTQAGDLVMAHIYMPQWNDVAIAAAPANYTRVLDSMDPTRRSTEVRSNAPAGVTGPIAHGITSGEWGARVAFTLVLGAA